MESSSTRNNLYYYIGTCGDFREFACARDHDRTIDIADAVRLCPNWNKACVHVGLVPVDPGLTSPSGTYRWLDVADQAYGTGYRNSYNYSQADVEVAYCTGGNRLQGLFKAGDLKPNFAYQLKLVGTPGTADNERVGLAGRWWQEARDSVEQVDFTLKVATELVERRESLPIFQQRNRRFGENAHEQSGCEQSAT